MVNIVQFENIRQDLYKILCYQKHSAPKVLKSSHVPEIPYMVIRDHTIWTRVVVCFHLSWSYVAKISIPCKILDSAGHSSGSNIHYTQQILYIYRSCGSAFRHRQADSSRYSSPHWIFQVLSYVIKCTSTHCSLYLDWMKSYTLVLICSCEVSFIIGSSLLCFFAFQMVFLTSFVSHTVASIQPQVGREFPWSHNELL